MSIPPFSYGNNDVRPAVTETGSSRSIAGATPKRSRSSTYSARARAPRAAADGARTARSITFFGGVLGRDELDHVDAVAERLERGGPQRVGHEVRLAPEQQPVAEQRVLLAAAICAASSWWQQGATTIASAPSRTPAAIASSVAVSHACSETSRSIGSSVSYASIVVASNAPRRSRARPRSPRTVSITAGLRVEPDELDARPDLAAVGDEREAHVRLAAACVDDADPVALPQRQRRAAARRSAAPAAPCRARSSSRRRADGRPAADAEARGRAPRDAALPTTAWRSRRASCPSSFDARGGRRRARAGARCARPRATSSSRAGQSSRGDRLGARAVDDLHRRPALERHRRRRDAVDDELAPAFAERTLASSSMLRSVPAASPPARAAAGAGTTRRRAARRPPRAPASARRASTAASPACHSSPRGPVNGRAQTTWPFATKNAAGAPSCSPGRDDADLEARAAARMPPTSRATSSSASIRSRSRAASSKRRSRASRCSFARSFGRASPSVSHSTPCSARAASCARRRLLSGPSSVGLRRADDAVAAAAQIDVAVGSRGACVRRRAQLADQPQLLERGLELRAEHAPLDPVERAERGLDRGPLPARSGSTSAAARAGRARGRRRAPGRARRGRGRRRAAAARRTRASASRARAAAASRPSSTRSATVRAPRSCAMPIRQSRISAVASASGSARWQGRASVTKRCESAARFAGCRPSSLRASPTVSTTVAATRLPVSRIVSLSRNAMSKRALCATRIASPAKREEAADDGRDGRRAPQLVVAQAGQRGDRRLQRARPGWRATGSARSSSSARTRTAPNSHGRAMPGRSPVVSRSKTTNVACSSSSSSPGAAASATRSPAQRRRASAATASSSSERASPTGRPRRASAPCAPPRPRRTGPRRSSTSSTSRSAASSRSCIRPA